MSDNTLRPIWTPDDFKQTVRDAAQHIGIVGAPAESEDATT